LKSVPVLADPAAMSPKQIIIGDGNSTSNVIYLPPPHILADFPATKEQQ